MEKPTKPITPATISPASPSTPTTSAEESGLKRHLYRKSPVPRVDYISCEQLANDLEVTVEDIGFLLEKSYLRIMSQGENIASTVVARPLPAAMDWLRSMFMPLELRPFIPATQVMDALGLTEDDFHYLCVTDNIPLHYDPAFGELMTVTGFVMLQKSWIQMLHPMRSDRQAILLMLGYLKGVDPPARAKPLPYSARIDNEIRRIAQMQEPDKTMRATDFWKAYTEAVSVANCLKMMPKGPARGRERMLHKRIEVMSNRMQRQGGKKIPATTAPDGPGGAASGASGAGHSSADNANATSAEP